MNGNILDSSQSTEAVMKYQKGTPRLLPALDSLRQYLANYENQASFADYTDEIFIDDVIYGLGVALDPVAYKWGQGFDAFRKRIGMEARP